MQKIKDISIGDFLTFKASDGLYRVLFCLNVYKERSPHHFDFAATAIRQESKPSIQDIRSSDFFGKGNRKDFRFDEEELIKMWEIHPEIKPYYLGTYGLLITRKAFMSFRERFELVCNLPILETLEQNGSGGLNASDMDLIDDLFVNRLDSFMESQGQTRFKTEAILRLEYKEKAHTGNNKYRSLGRLFKFRK
ncbi:MAG: hypothetical protein ACON5F_10720 [Jejuia sp.]